VIQMTSRLREWASVKMLWICCTTCCTTNPQQIELIEFGLNAAAIRN